MKKSIYSEKHKKLCELLIQARKDAGLTQQELADKIKRPQSFVAKYEGGERRLDLIELMEISKIINCDLSALMTNLDRLQ
ncbi:MAG: transcriptional regulator [Micavibrio sp. TMED27]|nr:transcriptional regulator [Micavibrio sp.]OUT92437.1 MAG: transcriptional regulator [Micavibrio sp. TMED27]